MGLSQTLPVTSYFKMIDIWMLFTMTVPFLEVVLHTVKEVFKKSKPAHACLTPRAENAKIDVKVIGASQEMCNYLPLLQKLPAALVIRKVKVTKHSSRVSLREIFT